MPSSTLSVFADESGEWGKRSECYLITLVFHGQSLDIAPMLERYRRAAQGHRGRVVARCGRLPRLLSGGAALPLDPAAFTIDVLTGEHHRFADTTRLRGRHYDGHDASPPLSESLTGQSYSRHARPAATMRGGCGSRRWL
ncbi:hypothetical protein EMB92_06120 [Bifidobacterium callitrichos]|uniref:DUF3800 domain-containing protein n=1 Tax=Bifidobacterium callitrichos TaxID=762209 RepID=A0A5M9ZCM1_9BIFI|nr:hypothetical protein EMB92_06120 [Bifidobacterium callitrichos]